jgi:hypothetical protein
MISKHESSSVAGNQGDCCRLAMGYIAAFGGRLGASDIGSGHYFACLGVSKPCNHYNLLSYTFGRTLPCRDFLVHEVQHKGI